MRRIGMLMAVLLSATRVGARQTSNTALCEPIVAQIRNTPESDWWGMLTGGARPYIELKAESEKKALGLEDAPDNAELVVRFTEKFNPTDELRKAWADSLENGGVDIANIAGSDVHVITVTGGTALCTGFTFFRATKGRPAELLPALPSKSDHDGDNIICSKDGADGYLARVGGVEAFVETSNREPHSYVRVVPLSNNRWGNVCAIDADYRMKYTASRTFVSGEGPLTDVDLGMFASQIVEQREAVKDAKDFAFGPPLSTRENEDLRTMKALHEKMGEEPVPSFGKELGAGEETLRHGDSFGLVLNGRVYLLRLGEGQLGCCYFPGPILIFYTLKDGKLEPVGTAIVEKTRGALQSVRVSESR